MKRLEFICSTLVVAIAFFTAGHIGVEVWNHDGAVAPWLMFFMGLSACMVVGVVYLACAAGRYFSMSVDNMAKPAILKSHPTKWHKGNNHGYANR